MKRPFYDIPTRLKIFAALCVLDVAVSTIGITLAISGFVTNKDGFIVGALVFMHLGIVMSLLTLYKADTFYPRNP